MSIDSTTRINNFFDAQVGTPNDLYTIHLDKNEDIPDDLGGGVFVKLSTEASFDERTGRSRPDQLFTETGLVIVEIIAPVGLGTLDTYSLERVVSLIRDAFRGEFLNPVDDEEGVIYFQDISTARSFELPSKMDGDYLVKNVFINYQKNYVYPAVVVDVPVNSTIPVVTGDTGEGDTLTTTTGSWTNSPTSYTYRWLRDDVAISGATASTYVLTATDVGTTIKSEVTAINAGGSSIPAESVGTAIPSGVIQRNLTTLDPALSQYLTLGSTIVLTGDYKIGFNFTSSEDSVWLGGGSSDNLRSNAGLYRMKIGGGNKFFGDSTQDEDGKQHSFELSRVGAALELFIDGSSRGTETSTANMTINRIAAITSTGLANGIISDVKITDAGTLIHSWALDETWIGPSTVAVDSVGSNNATAVGIDSDDSENFTFNGAVSPNTWTNDGATRVIEVAGT